MNEPLRSQDRGALDALRASTPVAGAAARRRTREAFLRPRARRRPLLRRHAWVASAMATAALIALWIGTAPNEGWTLVGVNGPAEVTRNGESVTLEPGSRFLPGSIVTGDSTEIEITRGDLHLRVRPGTVAEIPATPGRWFDRTRTIEVTQGEVFGSSGDGDPGFSLVLRTPEATARLTGTTFAVFRVGDATCFCLFAGGLDVTPHGGETFSLPVGRRVFVYDDGRPPSIEPLDAGETMKLQMIDDAARVR